MEFDKSRVYTIVNADELRVGDKVYVANKLSGLKYDVENECNLAVVEEIYNCDFMKRFKVKFCYNEDVSEYYLAYLVEKAEEKKWRPYKSIAEFVSDFVQRFNTHCPNYAMPLIWVRSKATRTILNIDAFYNDTICKDAIYVGCSWKEMTDLFEGYTFLDGSPCGKEIED